MLCEIAPDNFLLTWAFLTVIGFVMIMATSGVVFKLYYTNVTYDMWVHKTNPKFPSVEKVRDEIVQTAKGMWTATLCPALAIWLTGRGYSKAYCANPFDDEAHGGLQAAVISLILVVAVSDFWEWGYHRLGHTFAGFWSVHKHHHVFFNPSPFAVIADEYVDQFFRALPLLLFPVLVPINMDVMFFTYGLFFYAYGVYLHWGYESPYLSAHNPILNTAYHHYCHHAKAILNKPYHCGFFFKIWDQLTGGMYPTDKCFCCQCEAKKGNRQRKHFADVVVPDYSGLLSAEFWMKPGVFTGVSAKDTNEVLTEEERIFSEKGGKKK